MNLVMIVLALTASPAIHGASPLPSPSVAPAVSAPAASPSASGSPLPAASGSALPEASGSPAPGLSGSPLPEASGSPAPAASGSPGANAPSPAARSAAPAGTSTETTAPESYAYRFVPRQPAHPQPGVPQIFAVYLNSDTLTSTGPISIKVTTSPDVVKVVSHSGSHEGVIPRVVPGDFEANSKLPKVPFIASGMTLDLEFIATGPAGQKVSVKVPVKLK